jgi:LmbE family N-acetylglucosaminyl deacetylase
MSDNIVLNQNNNSMTFFSLTNSVNDLIETLNKIKNKEEKFILTIENNNIEISPFDKEDLFSGKSELKKLNHPFFLNKKQQICQEKELLEINKNQRILLFSPHPDDEILGASALLHHCFNNDINLKVVYMTSGKFAGSADTRRKEAIEAIKVLNGKEDNMVFCEMPFYDKSDRQVNEEDYTYIEDIITEHNPTSVYICGDVFDPKRTHLKCFDVLMGLFERSKYSSLKKYFYYSTWYWPKEAEYTHILPYDFTVYKLKINAMLEHRSQLENDFMGNDPRPFYQRAVTRDKQFGKTFNKGFCEVFYSLNSNN